ncbi:MAG: OmpA family protein [Alphaproteobacteria bacterium]|nr:OmpA family protein [Alphaproteobacteria bacterium]
MSKKLKNGALYFSTLALLVGFVGGAGCAKREQVNKGKISSGITETDLPGVESDAPTFSELSYPYIKEKGKGLKNAIETGASEVNAFINQVNMRFELPDGIKFKPGKTTLDSETEEALEELAKELSEQIAAEDGLRFNINITTHTDSIGTEESNKILSEIRALNIKSIFVSNGIDFRRIKALGMGEEEPIASNMLKAGREANRRGEIELHIIPNYGERVK